MKIAILDIGGSSIKYALMNENWEYLKRGKQETPLAGMDDLWDVLDKIWLEIGEEADGLAISMPGVIDVLRGFVYNAGALKYMCDYPFASKLEGRYHIPVWIGNDAKSAAIAEVGFGSLRGCKDAIVITLGTGIGGCLIKDGNVHNGGHFSAGEVSSMQVCIDNWKSVDNCWYMVNGTNGLISCVQKYLDCNAIYTGEEIFDMANSGNIAVLEALQEFCTKMAVQLFNMQCIFDAEKIAVGGGISAQPLLIKILQEKYQEVSTAYSYPVYQPEIVACTFYNDANMLGAAYQWKEMMKLR